MLAVARGERWSACKYVDRRRCSGTGENCFVTVTAEPAMPAIDARRWELDRIRGVDAARVGAAVDGAGGGQQPPPRCTSWTGGWASRCCRSCRVLVVGHQHVGPAERELRDARAPRAVDDHLQVAELSACRDSPSLVADTGVKDRGLVAAPSAASARARQEQHRNPSPSRGRHAQAHGQPVPPGRWAIKRPTSGSRARPWPRAASTPRRRGRTRPGRAGSRPPRREAGPARNRRRRRRRPPPWLDSPGSRARAAAPAGSNSPPCFVEPTEITEGAFQ